MNNIIRDLTSLLSLFSICLFQISCGDSESLMPDGNQDVKEPNTGAVEPTVEPTIFPTPYGTIEIDYEASEIVITLQQDTDDVNYSAGIQTVDGKHQFGTWQEYNSINPCPSITKGRWWSIDYGTERTVKIDISKNETGYIRWLIIHFSGAERDCAHIIQQPETRGTATDISDDFSSFNVTYINNSEHSVKLENVVWTTYTPDIYNEFVVTKNVIFPAYHLFTQTFFGETPNNDMVEFWCEAIPPISCTVIYDDEYRVTHSYFDDEESIFDLTNLDNYKLKHETETMLSNEPYHKWTLTFTFTDADYEYAVANGNIR